MPASMALAAASSDDPPVAHPLYTLMNGVPVSPSSLTNASA